MKIVVFLAILLALGGWRMVFSFSEKTSSFVRFFWRTKNRNEVEYISHRPCVDGFVLWIKGTP
jgi:hypothetical protein